MAARFPRIRPFLAILLLAASAHASFSRLAYGSLGDHVGTIENDRKIYRAKTHTVHALENYSVHELVNGATTIREYADTDGTVFAVTWRGGAQPDLAALLGTYLPEFQDLNRNAVRPLGRRSFSKMTGSRLVIERSGHMRAVHGKAYIPSAFPIGVTADVLQ